LGEEIEMHSTDGRMAGILRSKLDAAFRPDHLEVIDESEQHRGHGGGREGGETPFRGVMRAESLGSLRRVERSRAVHKVLAPELAGGVHALALDLAGS
jgi:BolA protein